VGLAGYSFGARVSIAAAAQGPQIGALLCVAPPLREPLSAESQPRCPFLVLLGDRDGNAAQGIERYASFLPDPQQLRVVTGTDHFWRGFEPVLMQAARDFFANALPNPAARVLP
jgi:alpha/beta superfamily hydrolase